jgi:hypothetical protein
MHPASSKKDRDAFLKALMLWDRPEEQLFGRPLAADTDTDDFIDRLFSSPGRGLLRD